MKRGRAGAAFLLGLFLLLPVLARAELRVHFIDVGQGDAILVQCDGESLLVDAGPAEAGGTVRRYLTETQGLDTLDHVIATHEHDDHLFGMPEALRGLKVGRVYSSAGVSSSYWFQTILPVLKQKSLELLYPAPLDAFRLGGASVTFVNPLTEAGTINDRSLAVRIEYEGTAVLLTADIEAEAESAMLREHVPLKADVLKVAHHGGNTSGSDAFIREVSPAVAVISVGAGNKHGHPHDEPLRILKKYGAAVYRTDYYGTIVCVYDGQEWTVEVSRAR